MDLTLLEVSLDGADITANAPFSGRGSSEADADDADGGHALDIDSSDDETSAEDRAGSSAVFPKAIAVALIGLLVVAALLKRRQSGDEAIDVE